MIEYNKLIRDKIPEIIEASGKSYDIRVADKKEHKELLVKKLQEEVSEYLEADNLEELADIMEVLYALAGSLGYSEEDLDNKRKDKREERGGFEAGLVLERTY